MDFAKFASLLHRSAIFFPTAARLGDPFEGSYPVANVRLRPTWYGVHAESIDAQSRQMKLDLLHSVLVSCWHINEVESAAMWSLYAKAGYGVAIRSTYTRLRDAIHMDRPFYIGMVDYLDYETQPMPEGNLFDPFLHKRTSFSHERELRVITERYDPPGTTVSWDLADGPPRYTGTYVPVDLGTLIDSVFLAPTSQAWVVEAVGATAERFGLAADVRTSALDTGPSY